MNNVILVLGLVVTYLVAVVAAHASDATFSASPAVLVSSGSTVTLSWSGVTDVTEFDTIGVYSPPDSPAAIIFHPVRDVASYREGKGTLELRLVNLRNAYAFQYHRFGKVLYTTNSVTFANNNEPLDVHLQFSPFQISDPTSMFVQWSTLDYVPDSVVQVGTAPGSYSMSFTHVMHYTYNQSMLAAGSLAVSTKGWRTPGEIYAAQMTGLQPSTRYYYRVGSPSKGMSKEFSFTSAPAQANPDAELKLSFIADMGCEGGLPHNYVQAPITSRGVLQDVQEWGSQFVIHVGDISYARGYGFIWSLFMDMIQNITSTVPYHVSMGNHERLYKGYNWNAPFDAGYGDDSEGEIGIPYAARFFFAPFAQRKSWYSFEVGSVHITVASGEDDFLEGSEQYTFLRNDLAKVDRKRTPWLFFAIHRPFYSVALNDNEIDKLTANMRTTLEPLLNYYQVDLVLSGHVHDYERSCAMVNRECVAEGKRAPVYAVSGSAGENHHAPFQPLIAKWNRYHTLEYGRSRIHIHNSTALYYEFLTNKNDEVADQFWVTH